MRAVDALIIFVAAVAAACTPSPPREGARPVLFRTYTMGSWASLAIVATDSTAVAGPAQECLRVFHHVDSLMSNWTTTSEVARLNRDASQSETTIHPEVAEVLALALEVGRQSDGAFDVTIEPLVRTWGFLGGAPRVPAAEEIDSALQFVGQDQLYLDVDAGTLRLAKDGVKIDLGGVAKGYAVDRAAGVLRLAGVRDALVDLSGNMAAIGSAPDHDGWRVGIRDPSGRRPWLARLVLEDEAVATSGDYVQFADEGGEKYGHILDPRTGWSAKGLSSVTVVASRAAVADAWATALFVLGGEEARRIARERRDLSVVLIEPGENGDFVFWVEEALRQRFTPAPDLDNAAAIRFY